ncbi:MAG: serine protease [Bacteroidota bacterium]
MIKYSYAVSGAYTDPLNPVNTINYTGSGFFVQANQKLFFVTARHVISGCSGKQGAIKKFPGTMNIFLHGENGDYLPAVIPVDIRAYRDSGVCPAIKYPDIAAVQLPDSFRSKVFTIPLVENEEPDISGPVTIPGYPAIKNAGGPGGPASSIDFTVYKILNNSSYINSERELETDSTNYILSTKQTMIDSSLKGYSGSPVFEFNKNNWHFRGILMGANIPGKYLVVVKQKYLKEILSRESE